MNSRVLVAMSGGVDSSLAAALLKEQGFAVEGVTMKLTAGVCCDIASAQAVCAHLDIPHRIIDMQEEFSRTVIGNFVEEYRNGRTPNPCIRCNDIIKFEKLLGHARSSGFRHLATGHYAQVAHDPGASRYSLKQGIDTGKDQSYFLYRLGQQQLSQVIFPLGGLLKAEVRRLAAAKRLPAADRPESQEVCFIPDNDYRTFLKEHAADVVRAGDMTLADGTVVGTHEGVAFYTIGQRRGLGVAAHDRLYVIRLDRDRNRVVIGSRKDLELSLMDLSAVRYLSDAPPALPFKAAVRVRYRSLPVPATIHPTDQDRAQVRFEHPVAGVSPGQAAVFYDNDTVVGGGIIDG